MADGTTFEIDIAVDPSKPTAAAAAVQALSDRLKTASTAATAAAQAVNAGEAAYKAAENAASKTALAVEKIGQAVEKQTGKAAAVAAEYGIFSPQFEKASASLAALTSRQTAAQTKAKDAASAMLSEAAALDKLKASSSGAEAAEKKLADAHTKGVKAISDKEKADKSAADAETKSIGNAGILEGALGKLGGPLGAIGQKAVGAGGALLKLSKTLGDAGPYVAVAIAMVAVAAGVAAVGIAAAVGTAKILAWAVGLADAARSQGLLAAGIAQSVAGGALLNTKIDSLQDTVPATREELSSLASTLAASGLRGKALTDALEKSAIAAAKLKFGPDWQKELNSIPNQTARAQRGFTAIFSGLKIEPLLAALSRVTDLFKENSATANAVKVVFESLFQPLLDGVTAWIPKMVTAFIQFEILVLKALIAIKPFGSSILLVAEIIGGLVLVIGGALAAALGIVIVAVGLMAVGFGVLIVIVTGAIAAVLAVAGAFVYAGAQIISGVGSAIDWLEGLSLSDIGTDLINGLVNGLLAAGPAVLNALKGIATGAIDAAKKALGIASPSKVFAEIGGYTAEGMQQGVEDGASGVQGAMTDMADPTAAAGTASSGSTATAKASGGGHTFNINVTGGGNAQSIAEQIRDAIQDLLTSGGGASPAAA